jgi:uncharacterized phiE125 gp8 family phage protein
MSLETLVAAPVEPVTLTAARAFLRIGTDGDDTVLASLLMAAREALEARTGRSLVTSTLRQRFLGARHIISNLPGTLLPGRAPATQLVAVRLIGADGNETPAQAGLVRLIDGRFVISAPLPSGAIGLSIDYQAGYGMTAAQVPEAFKISILEAVSEAIMRRDNGKSDDGDHWNLGSGQVKL